MQATSTYLHRSLSMKYQNLNFRTWMLETSYNIAWKFTVETDIQTNKHTVRQTEKTNRKLVIRKAYFILQIGLVKKTLLRISIIRLSIIIWKQRIRFVRNIHILSISTQSSFSGWCWSGKDIIIRTMCWFFYYNKVFIFILLYILTDSLFENGH